MAGVAAPAVDAAGLGPQLDKMLAVPAVDSCLERSLQLYAQHTSFTLSSCRAPDMPIVYASPGFYELTGFSREEIVGRNCRFLQGPGTSRQSILEIRNAIQEDRGVTVCILNYRKDGKPFWNQLCLAPVSDEHGVAYYLGIQTNVTGVVLAYRSQQFSPFQAPIPGPHGGVHSFDGCPDVVEAELRRAAELGSHIQRWHSDKLRDAAAAGGDPIARGPVSAAGLPTSLLTPLYKLHQAFVLADPSLPDTPIVHASAGFLELTGRPRDQVLGRNCRFMQGPATDRAEVARLKQAIAEQRPVTVRLLNYRHDGAPFWNNLHVAPVRNADGKVVFFVGVQLDITLAAASEARGQGCGCEQRASEAAAAADAAAEAAEAEAALPLPSPTVDPLAKQRQRSVIGTVRVVCRSLSAKAGLRRSLEDQRRLHPRPSLDGTRPSLDADRAASSAEPLPPQQQQQRPVGKPPLPASPEAAAAAAPAAEERAAV